MNKKVAIVGAGIAGITTAYYLARAGHEVVIYDKRKHPAMATSYGNGGQLSASNAETWNSWRSVKKGVKWLFKADAPLKINPSISIENIRGYTDLLELFLMQKKIHTIHVCGL